MAGALTPPEVARQEPRSPGSRGLSDRAVKIALLTASGVTLLFLVAAMVRENFLSPWRHQQRAYRKLLLESEDEQQQKLGKAFEIKVRQIDLPQLGTTDRCVSCHVGLDNPAMVHERQPFRPHSGDLLVNHPVEKYGCTICHQGQGLATNFREAKASDVHWDYPLLPARLTQASCGQCHAPDSALMAKHAPALVRGRQLFLDRGCQSCHKLDGVGGLLGPALDEVARKTRHQLPMSHVKGEHTLAEWLTQHFDQPQKIVPGSQMRPPRLTGEENEALTSYMLSLKKRDLPQPYIAPDRIAWLHEKHVHPETSGPVLYNRFCVNCHGDGSYGSWDKFFQRFTPAIRGPGIRGVADRDYLRTAIEQGRPGTQMPAWSKSGGGLTPAQIASLVEYLVSGDGRPVQELRPVPKVAPGDTNRGRELFSQLCAGCHGTNHLAPSLANPVFQKSASDDFILKTLCNGRRDTAMPAFRRDGADGLTDDELANLLGYIRSLVPKTR